MATLARLSLLPILHFQPWQAFELADVASDHNRAKRQRMRSDDRVAIADLLAADSKCSRTAA